MIDITTAAAIGIATILTSGGISWGATKQVQNGLKERIKMLETDNKQHSDRLARIETKIDALLER